MITFRDVSKVHPGGRWALRDLSVTIPSGAVTGLLGPNGAGKSSAMRLALGLDAPTSGTVDIDGLRYRDLSAPARSVGACLDGRSAHPGRSARAHLLGIARTSGIRSDRVDAVLEMVGLAGMGRRRAGEFSLGTAQRLGIATALLGDPGVLLLDEPVNGLDADGVRWVRELLRGFADEGRTVLLSSHLLAELEHVADRVVVIDRGELLHEGPTVDLMAAESSVRVTTASRDDAVRLAEAIGAGRILHQEPRPGALEGQLVLTGVTAAEVGDLAFDHGIPLHGLRTDTRSLEDGYTAIIRAHAASGARS